ncbi:IS6 family transposase [Escherichia coli]|nr:IS6 family transposase [Escherichia coli]
MNPFKGRHFQRDIILWAVRWYCKYGISYVMRALRKGQASAFYYGDPLGEMRLVSRVFEM